MSEYRYTLRRGPWLNGHGTVLFVMLNPSTAGDREDDPTIRRCIAFAQSWGFAWLTVANLYALRATDPRALFAAGDPVGAENDQAIRRLASACTEVVVAWGATRHPQPDRVRQVLEVVERYAGSVVCLGQTKRLHPRHPLYVRGDAPRQVFERLASAV